jgi:hypothetical protein
MIEKRKLIEKKKDEEKQIKQGIDECAEQMQIKMRELRDATDPEKKKEIEAEFYAAKEK